MPENIPKHLDTIGNPPIDTYSHSKHAQFTLRANEVTSKLLFGAPAAPYCIDAQRCYQHIPAPQQFPASS